MPRRRARMYHYPYDESGRYSSSAADLQVGDRFSTIAPHSEVMLHMNLAGKPIEVEIVSENAAQIYVDGKPFSFPVTLGEAGIYREGRRRTAADFTVGWGPGDPMWTPEDERFEQALEEYRQNVADHGQDWADGVLFSRHPEDAEYVVAAYDDLHGGDYELGPLDYEQDMADQVGYESDVPDAYHGKRRTAGRRTAAKQLDTEEYRGSVGINVKTHHYDFSPSGIGALSEADANSAMDWAIASWWDVANDFARENGLDGIESDGRMSGWLIPLWGGTRIDWERYSSAPEDGPSFDPNEYDDYLNQEDWENMRSAVDGFVLDLSTLYNTFASTILRDEVEVFLRESRRSTRRPGRTGGSTWVS